MCEVSTIHSTYHTHTHTDAHPHTVGSPLVDLIEEIRCYPVTAQPISAYIQK